MVLAVARHDGIALVDGKLLWQVAAAVERRAQNAVTPIVDGQTVR